MNNSYKGKLLISTPDASGDIFSRSVVLLLEHDMHGAFGLILNKKNKVMSDKLNDIFGFEVEVYDGGPVERDRIFFIIKGKPVTENFSSIGDDFYVTEDIQNVVTAIVEGDLDIDRMKVFAGYSGWAGMQLETEVKNKYWTVVDVYNLDYTFPNDKGLWRDIMQNLGGDFLIFANSPDDVTMN